MRSCCVEVMIRNARSMASRSAAMRREKRNRCSIFALVGAAHPQLVHFLSAEGVPRKGEPQPGEKLHQRSAVTTIGIVRRCEIRQGVAVEFYGPSHELFQVVPKLLLGQESITSARDTPRCEGQLSQRCSGQSMPKIRANPDR